MLRAFIDRILPFRSIRIFRGPHRGEFLWGVALIVYYIGVTRLYAENIVRLANFIWCNPQLTKQEILEIMDGVGWEFRANNRS